MLLRASPHELLWLDFENLPRRRAPLDPRPRSGARTRARRSERRRRRQGQGVGRHGIGAGQYRLWFLRELRARNTGSCGQAVEPCPGARGARAATRSLKEVAVTASDVSEAVARSDSQKRPSTERSSSQCSGSIDHHPESARPSIGSQEKEGLTLYRSSQQRSGVDRPTDHGGQSRSDSDQSGRNGENATATLTVLDKASATGPITKSRSLCSIVDPARRAHRSWTSDLLRNVCYG